MFKKIAVAGVAAALFCGVPFSVSAQDPVQVRSEIAPTQVSPEAIQLASRIFQLTTPDLEKKVTGYMREVMLQSGLAQIDPNAAAWFDKNTVPLLMPHLRTLITTMELRYAERLTIDELRVLVDFYDTPTGRSIAAKLLDLNMAMDEPVAAMTEAYMVDLFTAYCSENACDKDPNTAAK